MGWWKSLGNRIAHVGHRSRFDAELAAELQFHVESRIDDLERRGIARDEAIRQAQHEFGPQLRIVEDTRRAWQFPWVEQGLANIRYAVRQARKNPGFASIVIVTLGLGIGANSAVFSAVDAVLLRSLPFPEPDRLVRVYQRSPGTPLTLTSPARLADWERMNHTFQSISGYFTEDVSETSGELPERLTRAFVASRFLDVWGVLPALGRSFTLEEERDGGPLVVLISDRFWRRRFGGDPAAVGRQLRIGDASPTIVGVMPAAFRFPAREVDVWWPVQLNAGVLRFRTATWFAVIGRLKPGVGGVQARGDLNAVQNQLGSQYPQSDARLTVDVQPLANDIAGTLRGSLWLLFGSATLLLLLACVNVGGLLLVRATERRREIAVRTSLGASRRFVAVQLLTETAVLAVGGALLGLAIAFAGAGGLRSFASQFPRAEEIRTDWRVTLYSLAAALAVTFAAGLVPALRATGTAVNGNVLRAGHAEVPGRNRLQWMFAAIQIALAVVLLTGAGLLARSFRELSRVSPGFDASRITTFHISGSYGETNDFARLAARIDRTLDFLRSIPGVEAAATASALPGVPGRFQTELNMLEGRAEREPKLIAESRFVSSSYFSTVRIPVLAGETCGRVPAGAFGGALVNRTFADAYFRGSSPIGHHIRTILGGQLSPTATILGIVANAREEGLHRAPGPTVYWCSAFDPAPFFLIRVSGPERGIAETLRRTFKDFEPTRAVYGIVPLEEHLDDAYRENRLRTVLLVTFAAAAIILACVGLYGTLSYLVNSRRREVGLRLALGALRGQIVRRFLAQGVGVAAVACAAGLGLSALYSRWLAGMLYGVSPSDPLTLMLVTTIVLTGAATASLIPAARGALVEPMRVLRDE